MNIDSIILHSTQENLQEAVGLKNIAARVEPEGSVPCWNPLTTYCWCM